MAASVVDLPEPVGPVTRISPPGALRQLGGDRRQAEVLEGPHAEGDHPEHHRHAAALLEDVAAEPGQILDAERKVELVFLFEALPARRSY
jgi:hypothetical protein